MKRINSNDLDLLGLVEVQVGEDVPGEVGVVDVIVAPGEPLDF